MFQIFITFKGIYCHKIYKKVKWKQSGDLMGDFIYIYAFSRNYWLFTLYKKVNIYQFSQNFIILITSLFLSAWTVYLLFWSPLSNSTRDS